MYTLKIENDDELTSVRMAFEDRYDYLKDHCREMAEDPESIETVDHEIDIMAGFLEQLNENYPDDCKWKREVS